MAINDIYLNDFSVFKDIKIEFCKGINVVIGSNGTGKTHLLKIMYALHETSSYSFRMQNELKIPQDDHKQGVSTFSFIRLDFINKCFYPYPPYISTEVHGELASISRLLLTINDYITHELGIIHYCGLSSENLQTHHDNSVFIPVNDMLSHASLLNMSGSFREAMPFDNTHLKIIELARKWKFDETPEIARSIITRISKITEGIVSVKDDGSFWMRKNYGLEVPFSLEADGLKKFGLLWQLLANGSIDKNTVIFWDEPENSINPENIPFLVEILLELQRQGAQIFVTTHSYHFARYFEILKTAGDIVCFQSLYKSDDGLIRNTQAARYADIEINSIDQADEILYKKSIEKVISESKNG